MFEKTLYEQFKTNKQERLGILSLLSCVLGITVLAYFFVDPSPNKQPISTELKIILNEYYKSKPIETSPENKKVKNKIKTPKQVAKTDVKQPIQPYYFDPNTIEKQGLIDLGFSANLSTTFINFRNTGYTFKQPEDLLRVYNIDTSLVLTLSPYMLFKTPKQSTETKDSLDQKGNLKTKPPKKKYVPKVIEVNSATHEDLISIYGIGDVFADIIIQRRDRLGGYINHSQIANAFNFSDSTLQIFNESLTIDTSLIQKLNINDVTFKELLAHPYMTFEHTQILYPFIESRRPLKDLNTLENIMLIDSTTINKLKPYLTTQ